MSIEVAQAVLDVIRFGLTTEPDQDDLDEGRVGMYYYRRGLTKAQRQELRGAEAAGEDHDEGGAGHQPWHYTIVFRLLTSSECIRFLYLRDAVMVERVLDDQEMATLLLRDWKGF
ncbi:hypothetical protein [Streptomyces sp. CC210A]|uniref:hypothetical protein n=1 Tax=Streptomyces sp. CC210A TaxID=2898184 RepID=UPI001F46E430|nr:hypothetical protein [Streptomyces sp. CC210A]